MEEIIEEILKDSLKVKQAFVRENVAKLILLSERIATAFTNDNKLILCGNGGSAADAQHIAAEFVNRYIIERRPLPAIALTTDTSVMTSIGNDYSFEKIFSKQVQALGMEGDVLLAISTSGNSENVLWAVREARSKDIYTAALLGKDGGKIAEMVDLALTVKSDQTPRIQEAQILAGHIVCHLVDHLIFQKHTAT